MINNIRKQMSRTSGNWGTAFTEEIRRRAGEEASAAAIERLKGLVTAFPDMAAQLRSWSREPGLPAAARRLQEFVDAYIRNPDDVLSDKLPGFFGYMDDAYVTARIYEATVLATEWDRTPGTPPPGGYEKEIPLWIAEIRRVLPDETARIDAMINLVFEGARRSGLRMIAH